MTRALAILSRWFFGAPPEMIVRAPVQFDSNSHAKLLKDAAIKYGKPWKCGPQDHRREVLVMGAGEKIAPVVRSGPKSNVQTIEKRRKA